MGKKQSNRSLYPPFSKSNLNNKWCWWGLGQVHHDENINVKEGRLPWQHSVKHFSLERWKSLNCYGIFYLLSTKGLTEQNLLPNKVGQEEELQFIWRDGGRILLFYHCQNYTVTHPHPIMVNVFCCLLPIFWVSILWWPL